MEEGNATPELSKSRRFSRPKLKIPQINMANLHLQRQPEIPVPMTAGCAIPIGNVNGPFGLFQFYPTKASEFMNKRYENFKDFTKNTAKSGLSFGEKALFWLNGRVRQLSKKWFTHIFLFLVVLLYSFLGAIVFVTVEGSHENAEKADLDKELNLLMSKVRGLAMEKDIVMNSELWRKNFKSLMAPYENQLLESFRHGVTPDEHKTWSFWNSMFYCGTIYTTIEAKKKMDESGGQIAPAEGLPVSGSSSLKKKKNVTSKSADRIKNRLSKSPKRRAGTPEPETRTFTDDSEKEISDWENLSKSAGEDYGDKGQQTLGIRRFFNRSKRKSDICRSRSLERQVFKEPESEDDFEMILRMHKTKEIEEEKKEVEKLLADTKPRVKEEPKDFVPKEMPPLIVAPKESKDVKKRKRHKSLPLQESQSEDDKPKTPLLGKRPTRRKVVEEKKDDSLEPQRGFVMSEDNSEELRHRKMSGSKRSLQPTENETSENVFDEQINKVEAAKTEVVKKPWFFKRWFGESKRKEEKKEQKEEVKKEKKTTTKEVKEKRRWFIAEVFYEWRTHVTEHREYYNSCRKLRNRCITDLLILLMFCGCGGLIFRFTEGAFESFYKCGVKRVKRDFIDTLWKNSQYMLEDDWKSQARRKLMEFENQLHSAHEAGMTTYSGQKSWSFLNAVIYCLTVVTTIGYGHISPSTTTGRAITIIYAIFGIPMFLILLADFGKLFTRGIKFVWAFVRRLYYTGSCRKVRKTAPVQEVMKGVQIMYDFAKSRRLTSAGLEFHPHSQNHLRPPEQNMQNLPETPIRRCYQEFKKFFTSFKGTPNWSTFEIDDEFNLPITVAFSILLIYIFFGAFLYWIWEEWSFFESFYFVFISMSTIGFGDFVPQSPMYMMLSIVYLIFGLALTSMCINVVQEKLSDTFRQASAKLGTTIGLSVAEDGVLCPVGPVEEVLNMEPNQTTK